MKVTKEDACVILPRHELADSYPRLQSALPRRRVELMKTQSPRVEPQTYHVTVSRRWKCVQKDNAEVGRIPVLRGMTARRRAVTRPAAPAPPGATKTNLA